MNVLTQDLTAKSWWSGILAAFETWFVWLFLMAVTFLGVFVNFQVFPPSSSTLDPAKVSLLTAVIAVAMNNLTYAPKWANTATRRSLSPLEIGQYLIQGFGWAATWPALADAIGSSKIDPAKAAMVLHHLLA